MKQGVASTPVYPHTASQAAFLLGGIGTGNISVGARGDLRDWEIFNKPAKGQKLPYSFFAMDCRPSSSDGPAVTRVLEAPMQPPFAGSQGFHSGTAAGLPHFGSASLKAEYPFAWVELVDEEVPLGVTMESFSPFIPLDSNDSGLPLAVIRYIVESTAPGPLTVSIVGSLPNAVGSTGFDQFGNLLVGPGCRNAYVDEGACRGIVFSSAEIDPGSLQFGTMCLMTTEEHPSFRTSWLRGGWFDGIQDFWDDFTEDGALAAEATFDAPGGRILTNQDRPLVGSLCVARVLDPGQRASFTFLLAWHFPNRPRDWNRAAPGAPQPVVRNHYAVRFPDAVAVSGYAARNLDRLEAASRSFRDALYGSSLPPVVIDAVSSAITVLRSPTCFRLEDGTFVTWEGCCDTEGCCEGSCTHVWNYAQGLAFLFPDLERSMLDVAFNLETDAAGRMAFRTHRVFGLPAWDMVPAADGQLGTIVRLYRYWKLTGDDGFLRSAWQNAARSLDFAGTHWDRDGDNVLDAEQHTTYDIEFHGMNSYTSLIYYAALKAAAEMADYLGDTARGVRYERAWQDGARRMDALLWNGRWYEQALDDVNRYRYQFGRGCLTDQLLGQSLACTAGIGHLVPPEHARVALQSIVRQNFRQDFRLHANTQRSYAMPGEAGTVLCTWPDGGRPRLPFVYCDEVWSGVEYQLATHLFHEGLVEEGLSVVRAVRNRYDGVKRNPWNEVECGHHYVRSLASWGLLVALCGFHCDLPRRRITFDPRIHADDFSAFFSTGTAWGVYRQRRDPATGRRAWGIDVLFGTLQDVEVNGTPEQ